MRVLVSMVAWKLKLYIIANEHVISHQNLGVTIRVINKNKKCN